MRAVTDAVGSSELIEDFRIPNAAELIAGHLRRRIVRGELAEGTSLPPENKLRAQYGVSGPTLRAAYRVLEAEGLISVRRGSRGGAQIHRPQIAVASRYVGLLLQMDGATLDDLFTARVVLEPPLAGMAAKAMTRAGRIRLQERLEGEEGSLQDGPAFARASSAFHHAIINLSGNHTLALLAGLLWNLIEAQVTAAVIEAGDSPAQLKQRRVALHAHQRLVELLVAKNCQGAEDFWRNHMEAVAKLMSNRHGSTALFELFA
jgi:DNA-binding FadR family transcriptional regulator